MTAQSQDPVALDCRGVSAGYGATLVLDGLDLRLGATEAVAILGPSGCGKTTLLHAVAGFVPLRAGEVRIGDDLVATSRRGAPPEARRVGMVFQNYALWPHLSALDTVAYPFRRDGLTKDAARRQAYGLLERMGVAGLAQRRPDELSGGEQQRVGVARALARRAALYLFDEPTAHLDAPLRDALQGELAAQRADLGAAVLYATHDVAEALAVADRVGLLRRGRIVQLGTPREVYEEPIDLWAARLTGPAAVLDLPVARADAGTLDVVVAGRTVTVRAPGRPPAGARARALLRPEWARLGGPLPGRVTGVRYRGADTDYRLDTPVGAVEVRERGAPRARPGESAGWRLDRCWLLPSSADAPAEPKLEAEPVAPGSVPVRSGPR